MVEPHRLADGIRNGREPEAAAECVAPEGSTFGCGENQSVGSGGMVSEVLVDDVGELGRHRYGSAGGCGLGWPEAEMAANLAEAGPTRLWINVAAFELSSTRTHNLVQLVGRASRHMWADRFGRRRLPRSTELMDMDVYLSPCIRRQLVRLGWWCDRTRCSYKTVERRPKIGIWDSSTSSGPRSHPQPTNNWPASRH